jgi:predicted secreted hydrolase
MSTHALKPDKFRLRNLGVPIFVDVDKHLLAVPGATQDSWYAKATFEADDKQIGFLWHQHVNPAGADAKTTFGEFVVIDGTDKVFIPIATDEPAVGGIGASETEVDVRSSLGALTGDRHELKLAVSHEGNAMDLEFSPREVLYNGTTGYLSLMTGSYQFAFPNMEVRGTVTIEGRQYEVPEDTTTWFDRQWSHTLAPDALSQQSSGPLPTWLWIGTPINDATTAAISLWDVFVDGTRRTFATILDEDGLQYNVVAEVTYDQIWTSELNGNSYPRELHVDVPAADLELSFTALLDEPAYDHGGGAINGAYSLSKMRGSFRGRPIDGHHILEMVGDLCG